MTSQARLLASRIVVPVLGSLMAVSVAWAASGTFSLFGGATVQGSAVKLVSNTSNTSTTDDYSGIAYTPTAPLKVSDITNLRANLEAGAECGLGSPRFSIDLGGGQNIVVYLGNPPDYTVCPSGDTGNLVDDTDLVDTSHIPGGTFYDTWLHAKTLVGNNTVGQIALIVDSGWNAGVAGSDQTETVIVKSVTINGDTYQIVGPPTSKDQCKDGGWKSFNNPAFKNQGDCVSFVATGGKNPPGKP